MSYIYLPLLHPVESQRPASVWWKAWDRSIDWKRLRGFKCTIPRGQVLIHQSAEPEQGAAELSRHSDSSLFLFGPEKVAQCWNCKRDSPNRAAGKRLVLISSYLWHLCRVGASVTGKLSMVTLVFEVLPSALQWADEVLSAVCKQLCSGFIKKQGLCGYNVCVSEWGAQKSFPEDGKKLSLFSKSQGLTVNEERNSSRARKKCVSSSVPLLESEKAFPWTLVSWGDEIYVVTDDIGVQPLLNSDGNFNQVDGR